MISILIPVYNRNVVQLIISLQSQISTVKAITELVVMDDGSSDQLLKNINKENLAGLDNIQYIELPYNTGRNVIRHKLASVAKYNTLIFLDADSNLVDAFWLERYINDLTGDAIIMGGRSYKNEMSVSSLLHSHYGKSREQKTATQRNKNPYRSFLACNFLISKQQLSQLIIDNHLWGYCHEDTFMGLQFEKLNIPVKHIDNPVYHEGIDDDLLFMQKQYEALENLQYLYHTYCNKYNFDTEIKLIRIYKNIIKFPAGKFLLNKMVGREEFFKSETLKLKNLTWLDFWKLTVFHRLLLNR